MKQSDPEWAWSAYQPDEDAPWNLIRAGHLFRRAGFGANRHQLETALAKGPVETIQKLIDPVDGTSSFDKVFDDYETSAENDSAVTLGAWWLRRMIETPHPLLERLTLFWHSHFAVSNAKVGSLRLAADHVRTLRTEALGDYRELLATVTQHPATFLAFESSQNRKSNPSISLPEQLLEQYTLGPQRTSVADVETVARAFSGWFVRGERLHFVPREHDRGPKSFLGFSGDLNLQDILDILNDQPATARLIVKKMYRFLISETEEPPDSLLAPLVDSFSKDFQIGKLLQRILQSNLFFSNRAYRKQIKSPVTYAIGIVKMIDARVPTLPLSHDVKMLGQELYNPPTRRGWSGGRAWVSPSMMIQRANFAAELLAKGGRYGGKGDPWEIIGKNGSRRDRSQAGELANIFLQGDLDRAVVEALKRAFLAPDQTRPERFRRLAHGLVTLPEFQLA